MGWSRVNHGLVLRKPDVSTAQCFTEMRLCQCLSVRRIQSDTVDRQILNQFLRTPDVFLYLIPRFRSHKRACWDRSTLALTKIWL